jgi:hypothetical protein
MRIAKTAGAVTLMGALLIVEGGEAIASCENRIDTDIGRCDLAPGQHSRTVVMTFSGSAAATMVGTAASYIFDADDYQSPSPLPTAISLSVVPPKLAFAALNFMKMPDGDT